MVNPLLLSHRITGLEIKGLGLVFVVQDTSGPYPFNVFTIDSSSREVRLKGTLHIR